MKLDHILSAALLSTSSLFAQTVLHYKFDGGCGAEVINFAPVAAPGNAVLTTTLAGGVNAARIPGQFGQAITGSSSATGNTKVDTGWAPFTPTGDFSFAMWIRNPPTNPTSIGFGYLFGATGGNFRLFTGSSGRMFLSGFPGSATSAVDLTPQLNAGWVHIACTVDGTAQLATWYINGVADPAVSFTQAVSLAGTDFAIGSRNTTGSSYSPLDTDEFLLATTVWSAAEVQALAQAPRAADGDYSSGVTNQCGAGNVTLGSTGGTPAPGNFTYTLTIDATTPSLYLLLAGTDRCTFGGAVPLPLDGTPILPLLSGCWILADAPVLLNGVIAGMQEQIAFPILPNVPVAANVYMQALTIDLATLATSMSAGFAISTGL